MNGEQKSITGGKDRRLVMEDIVWRRGPGKKNRPNCRRCRRHSPRRGDAMRAVTSAPRAGAWVDAIDPFFGNQNDVGYVMVWQAPRQI